LTLAQTNRSVTSAGIGIIASPRTRRAPVISPTPCDNAGQHGLVKRWAERKRATPAQIALAWLLAQKPWIVPIPGTTQMAHMLENTGAADVRFTAAELAELNSAVRAIEIRGQRLPDAVLVYSGVEAPPKK
jgi:diketogulonate reductase-like aldo/keto reductase